MTATRRGRRSSGADNYPTPEWTIERFMEEWDDLHLVGNRWLEPCAGDGVIIDVVNRFRPGIDWTAVEIRESTRNRLEKATGKAPHVADFLGLEDWAEPFRYDGPQFDVAIMNPPFRLTMEFILRCLQLAKVVVCLQRMNYCGTGERNEFFRSNMPNLYVVPDRVSFTGDGNADACEHAWHVWGPDTAETHGLIRVLALTSKEARKSSRRRIVTARSDVHTFLDELFAEAGAA